MKRHVKFWIIGTLQIIAVYSACAQEQESAELYLEAYTDEFQENFFEALKQKSIQNYDKAINLFLACKNLDPSNPVIDYQLAKTYFLDQKYVVAQDYAISALQSTPSDFWYLENLVNISSKLGSPMETYRNRIPYGNIKLQENLALIYFKQDKYSEALKILEALGDSEFAHELGLKIKDSLQQRSPSQETARTKKTVEADDPIAGYRSRMEELIKSSDYVALEKLTKEALENYPLQAFFHYGYGTALNGMSDTAKAIEVLESSLDYVFDDDALSNKIYKELAKAYTTLGNTTKATEYLNKVKTGL
nr:hypothetical protein [Allomuricauda sp.]